jgi:gliding motility-associated lipoprotein GldB
MENKMMKFKLILIAVVVASALLLGGCGCNTEQKKIDAKVHVIQINLKINRFDKDLFQAAHQNNFDELQKKYPAFFKLYVEQILQIGKLNDSTKLKVTQFCNNKSIAGLQDTVLKYYSNFNPYQSDLEQAFRYHKYYFPTAKIPTIYTFISEFGYGVITTDSAIGIGLDMFLGEQYPYYQSLGFPKFIIKKCVAKNIVPSVMKAWQQNIAPDNFAKRRLIDRMIAAGKSIYYLDKVMPSLNDSIKINYSTQQLLWCNYNEFKIWEYFIKHNLLYTTDLAQINHIIGDSPVTPGMPPEAPGNIGAWVGWQIVKQYMNKNSTITMQQLMNETDGQKILDASKYKPSKK